MAGHMVLIGWALWVSPCGTDSCDALPVTETIFTQEQCMSRKIPRIKTTESLLSLW